MKIDLHNHSKYSDGLYTVKEVLNFAKENGVTIMGLTDHDSCFGCDEAYEEGEKIGIKVLKGMEVSTFYKGQTVHIISYFKNNILPKEAYEFSKNIIDTRINRAKKMMENIQNYYNVNIDFDYLFKDSCIVTRGNMYQCILHSNPGIAHEEAHKMVSDDSPCYIPASKLDTISGLEILRKMGAFTILAHPTLIKEELLSEIVSLGFDGIEARYPLNKSGEEDKFKDIAHKNNLIISAGSDFHGDDKHAMIGTSFLNYEEFKVIKEKLELGSDFNED